MFATMSRRALVSSSTGLGLAALAPAARAQGIDLANPKVRSDIHAKIYATTAEGEVWKYWTVHYYAYVQGGANMVPLYTMLNLNYSRWKSAGNGAYTGTAWEVGVYTDYDGTTILDKTWQNPVTGKEQPIMPFKGGPWPESISADGIAQTNAGANHLKVGQVRVIADTVWLPTATNYNFSFPASPDGKRPARTTYWDSYFDYGAKVADVLDPSIASAHFVGALHNLADWYPGMGMEGNAGRVFGRAPGQKLKSRDELPDIAKTAFDRHVPDIFDIEKWKAPRFG
ncbi:MAG: DUF1838 domain-containing protein [Alphaproteobacteria bacterium]|nr:DUF1838 domain-containing protein [Alphaproteobacteria bacterium]